MHERELKQKKKGKKKRMANKGCASQCAWRGSSREKIRETDMNGEWRWTGAVTRLSINSAFSASAS